MFAIHGIPQEIVTDNGPQFRNEFRNFTQQLDIKHITTSPYHPQGNGKAENAVKTTKRIFKKCNGSEQLAILEHNNTTTEGLHLSPAEIMFGRKCRTKLMVLKKVLKPIHELKEMEEQREIKLRKQKIYYDRGAKKKQKIENQDEIIIIKPGETTWSEGKITEEIRDRSYKVEVDGKSYVRNRIDIQTLINKNKDEEKEVNNEEEETIRRSGRKRNKPERYQEE